MPGSPWFPAGSKTKTPRAPGPCPASGVFSRAGTVAAGGSFRPEGRPRQAFGLQPERFTLPAFFVAGFLVVFFVGFVAIKPLLG